MKKDILVIGGGGREHAICCQLKCSENVGRIYAAPGNAGIAQIAECLPIKATEIDKITEFVANHPNIYMTVVAPDDPLSMGLVDKLEAMGRRAFGPSKAAAYLESSKVFAKELMQKYNIPTAQFAVFDDLFAAKEYLKSAKYPLVIKADGLALGKGVIICQNESEATVALLEFLQERRFGSAGETVVIEEFLSGYEVSVLAFTDGKTIRIMPTSRDYKRAHDGDKGLNTGGMGAFSPVTEFEPLLEKAQKQVFEPTIRAMKAENREFRGVIYFGLMIDGEDIKVLEYNARFGDPETQVVLPALKTDLLTVFDAIIDGRLAELDIEWDGKNRVCVVAASSGYPLDYKKGEEIFIGGMPEGATVFHAGTTMKDGRMVTSGGRVLCVCAADTLQENAREKAYQGMKKIIFDGKFFRTDIAAKK